MIRNSRQPSTTRGSLRPFTLRWLPLILYCAAIFIQSSFPAAEVVAGAPFSDKLLHFLAYAVMGMLFFRAYRTLEFGHRVYLVAVLSAVSAGLYGAGDELHQYFVPSREADFMDLLADVCGGIAGAAAALFYLRYIALDRNNHVDKTSTIR